MFTETAQRVMPQIPPLAVLVGIVLCIACLGIGGGVFTAFVRGGWSAFFVATVMVASAAPVVAAVAHLGQLDWCAPWSVVALVPGFVVGRRLGHEHRKRLHYQGVAAAVSAQLQKPVEWAQRPDGAALIVKEVAALQEVVAEYRRIQATARVINGEHPDAAAAPTQQ